MIFHFIDADFPVLSILDGMSSKLFEAHILRDHSLKKIIFYLYVCIYVLKAIKNALETKTNFYKYNT